MKKSSLRTVALLSSLFGSTLLMAQVVTPPSVTWAPYSAVPLDRNTLLLIVLLLGAAGAWFLKNHRKPVQNFLVAAFLVSAAYQYSIFATPAIVEMSGSGTQTFNCGDMWLIQNTSSGDLLITGSSGDDPDCEFYNTDGMPNGTLNEHCDFQTGDTAFTQILPSGQACYFRTRNTGNV